MNKTTWEDILPEYCNEDNSKSLSYDYKRGYDACIEDSTNRLKHAEKEGKCCLNPPDEIEMLDITHEIYFKFFLKQSLDSDIMVIKEIIQAIAKRIKEGK